MATHNTSAEIRAFVERNPIAPGRASATARAALEQRTVHVLDAQTDPEYTYGSRQVEPFRTILTVPMLKAGEMLGVILVYRLDVRPFTDSQIALLETFADQAVIAIENVRLFDEVQAKTHDLTELLEQQTSMGEILRVISSSAMDIQPVFETIASNSVNLCGAAYGVVYRFDGEVISIAAHHNVDPTALDAFHQIWPMRPNANAFIGRAILERKALYVLDVAAEPGYTFAATHQEALGLRTFLSVPMLRDGNPIGAIAVYRKEVKPFSNRQIELVKAFADQAVIAVENVRLFDELQARTEDLRELLQQQTATADVLKVISRSTLDVERDLEFVLETLLESAIRLCGATRGHVYRYDGEFLRFAAAHGAWPGFRATWRKIHCARDVDR